MFQCIAWEKKEEEEDEEKKEKTHTHTHTHTQDVCDVFDHPYYCFISRLGDAITKDVVHC